MRERARRTTTMLAAKEWLQEAVGTSFHGPPPKGIPALPSIARVSPRVVRVLGLNPSGLTLQVRYQVM